MITRRTAWIDDRGNCVQVALCVLDELWEPLTECTEQLGPFDDVAEAWTRCSTWVEGWLASTGYQTPLPF